MSLPQVNKFKTNVCEKTNRTMHEWWQSSLVGAAGLQFQLGKIIFDVSQISISKMVKWFANSQDLASLQHPAGWVLI